MDLADLIRGNSRNQDVATAISATDAHEPAPTVAKIAAVAVAKSRNAENEKPPEPIRRQPTAEEARELKALIRACGEPYGFTESDTQEAWARVLDKGADASLVCYRHLAKTHGIDVAALLAAEPDDDRVTCRQCVHLNEFENCRVAHPWTPVTSTMPIRKPVPDLLRRCDGYQAKAA